ncbi:hypothetical protein GPJ56_003387 [Histomonas meleagridis]|uniref:uncharacterized protein n=1 Tax=Histomonas meleagridis TaxID=135588 RepID=UPI003559DE41|nr:hypothetical protein GPJ56_003387 [Histomonas meleagridis]KAH0805006.1 hypothetical protein GO595_001951 [Histomonas meleagridis]
MPPRKAQGLGTKPVYLSPDLGNKCSTIEELIAEIKSLEESNSVLQEQVENYDKESLNTIKEYRTQIDQKTTEINTFKHQIDKLYVDKDKKIQELREESSANKSLISQEDSEVCSEIDEIQHKLETIKKFEEDKEKIQKEIQDKENEIEQEKQNFENNIEMVKKTTENLLSRYASETERSLNDFKTQYYEHLLKTTDQSVLLHIQRRNDYENDLQSLQMMYNEYQEKIRDCEENNRKRREAIAKLKQEDVINQSAEQHQSISSLRKEIANAKQQLKDLQQKANTTQKQNEEIRSEESNKLDLAIRLQQDKLDQKLQQIDALRELTLTVLSYRSQLEAEFITVLGEVIYEVRQRDKSRNTSHENTQRKLTFSSSSSALLSRRSNSYRERRTSINNGLTISHTLSQFTMEDRLLVIQRFMERVNGFVKNPNQNDNENSDEDVYE